MSFEDHENERTIAVRVRWASAQVLEVPDHVSTSEARDQIRDGNPPAWARAQAFPVPARQLSPPRMTEMELI